MAQQLVADTIARFGRVGNLHDDPGDEPIDLLADFDDVASSADDQDDE